MINFSYYDEPTGILIMVDERIGIQITIPPEQLVGDNSIETMAAGAFQRAEAAAHARTH